MSSSSLKYNKFCYARLFYILSKENKEGRGKVQEIATIC